VFPVYLVKREGKEWRKVWAGKEKERKKKALPWFILLAGLKGGQQEKRRVA